MAAGKSGSKIDVDSLVLTSTNAVAKMLGVSNTTVSEDYMRKGMPGTKGGNGKPGNYPVAEIWKWYREHLKSIYERPVSDGDDLRERLEAATVRKMEAQATIEEIKQMELEGRLIDRGEAMAVMSEAFHRVRTRIEAVPQEMGGTFPPENRAELIADLGHKLRLILREMSEWTDLTESDIGKRGMEILAKCRELMTDVFSKGKTDS